MINLVLENKIITYVFLGIFITIKYKYIFFIFLIVLNMFYTSNFGVYLIVILENIFYLKECF